MPGKKDTITRRKMKRQKRLLNDSLQSSHLKYNAEYPNEAMSYSLFCRLRPFWVRLPEDRDRETCLCKQHENMGFIVEVLHRKKVLETKDVEVLAESVTCGQSMSKDCAYGTCPTCRSTEVSMSPTFDPHEVVKYFEWQQVTEEKKSGEDVIKIKRTVKVAMQTTLIELVDKMQTAMVRFKRHIFNIRHQFKMQRAVKEKVSISEENVILHIDFAENYSCKYGREVQSVHFGGGHQQVTLHTGVLFTNGVTESFCTVSPNTTHNPITIWQFLDPVFLHIKAKYPTVKKIHFFSDGPTTQYRQKGHFYLLSTEIFKHFESATWHFSEAGHGKGAPDGVGGALKRNADNMVAQGHDITDARSFVDALKDSSVKLFYVDNTEYHPQIPANLKSVPGTMSIHQILTERAGEVWYRDVSCSCLERCNCVPLAVHNFLDNESAPGPVSTNSNDNSRSSSKLQPIDLSQDLVGTWCVVEYDQKAYPGVVLAVEDRELQVKCMHSVGRNRYFLPLIDDVCWYPVERVITQIQEPVRVTQRHKKIDDEMYDEICALMP